jgi:hypothetical protein
LASSLAASSRKEASMSISAKSPAKLALKAGSVCAELPDSEAHQADPRRAPGHWPRCCLCSAAWSWFCHHLRRESIFVWRPRGNAGRWMPRSLELSSMKADGSVLTGRSRG